MRSTRAIMQPANWVGSIRRLGGSIIYGKSNASRELAASLYLGTIGRYRPDPIPTPFPNPDPPKPPPDPFPDPPQPIAIEKPKDSRPKMINTTITVLFPSMTPGRLLSVLGAGFWLLVGAGMAQSRCQN